MGRDSAAGLGGMESSMAHRRCFMEIIGIIETYIFLLE